MKSVIHVLHPSLKESLFYLEHIFQFQTSVTISINDEQTDGQNIHRVNAHWSDESSKKVMRLLSQIAAELFNF